MAEITKELGRIPVSRGDYQAITEYYKDNIVQYKRGSYQVVSESPIIGIPPTNDKNVLNPGWILFAGTLDAQDVVNQIKEQEAQSIQAIADREAEILSKTDASKISTNTTGLEGNNVQDNLDSAAEKLTELESIADDVNNATKIGSNVHIATYVAAFEEENFSVASTVADIKPTSVIPNQRIKVYIKSSSLQRFEVYDLTNLDAGPFFSLPLGTDFSDGLTFEFSCPASMNITQWGKYEIVFRTWLVTTLDNFNVYRLEPNKSSYDQIQEERVAGLELYKNDSSLAMIYDIIVSEGFIFSSIHHDSKGKVLESVITWPDKGTGNMTIHYNSTDPEIIDYVEYTKYEGTLGNTGTYRNTIVYDNGVVLGTVITKES